MQFNLRFFQMALMTSACLTSFCYSASSDVVVVDDLLSAQPKKTITPGLAVNNIGLRDDFFKTFDGDKEKLLKALIGIAVMDVPFGKQTKEFLEEAARKSFFTVEELAIPLDGEKASLAQYLQGAAKWSTTTASQQPLPIQVHAFATPQTLHIEQTDLPGALRITPTVSTLTLSEQVYALDVRSNLGGAGLDAALGRLDQILTLTQAVFDAFLGTIVKPAAVPLPADFRVDPTPANRLASAVQAIHATLPAIVASRAFTVNSNGTVGDETENAATAVICEETTEFLKEIWAAAILTNNTAITEFVAPIEQEVSEHKE
jgi:hypothetical protein